MMVRTPTVMRVRRLYLLRNYLCYVSVELLGAYPSETNASNSELVSAQF